MGLMIGIEIVTDSHSKQPAPHIAASLRDHLAQRYSACLLHICKCLIHESPAHADRP